MRRGEVSFLSLSTPEEAWAILEPVFAEERYVMRNVAKGVGVTPQTLMRWLKKNFTYYELVQQRHKELLLNEASRRKDE